MATRNADWLTSLDLACAWTDCALAPVHALDYNHVPCGRHAERKTAHAHVHHPYQHTALDIFDCHFEPSLYQGASASPLAGRGAIYAVS